MSEPGDDDACLGCFPPRLWEPYQRSYYANAKSSSFTLLEYLRRTSKTQKLKNRINVIDKLQAAVKANEVSLPCFVSRLLQGFSLKRGVKRSIDGIHDEKSTHAADDLELIAKRWCSQRIRKYNATLQEQLLQFSEMLSDKESESYADVSQNVADTVFVATIHKSKGKEFHVVFILDANAENFGGCPAERPTSTVDDERRLLYVAASRAKKSLYISFTGAYSLSTQSNRISTFLDAASSLSCVRSGRFPPVDSNYGEISGQGVNYDAYSPGIQHQDRRNIERSLNVQSICVITSDDQSHGCGVLPHGAPHRVVKAKKETVDSTEAQHTRCVSFFSYTKKS